MTFLRDTLHAAIAAYEVARAETVDLASAANEARQTAVHREIDARLAMEVAKKALHGSSESRAFVIYFANKKHTFEARSPAEATELGLAWMRAHGWNGDPSSLGHLWGEDGTDDYIPVSAPLPPPTPGTQPGIEPSGPS